MYNHWLLSRRLQNWPEWEKVRMAGSCSSSFCWRGRNSYKEIIVHLRNQTFNNFDNLKHDYLEFSIFRIVWNQPWNRCTPNYQKLRANEILEETIDCTLEVHIKDFRSWTQSTQIKWSRMMKKCNLTESFLKEWVAEFYFLTEILLKMGNYESYAIIGTEWYL